MDLFKRHTEKRAGEDDVSRKIRVLEKRQDRFDLRLTRLEREKGVYRASHRA